MCSKIACFKVSKIEFINGYEHDAASTDELC